MPRFFLMFSCGPIPGAFLNSGPVTRCFFFYSGILRSNSANPMAPISITSCSLIWPFNSLPPRLTAVRIICISEYPILSDPGRLPWCCSKSHLIYFPCSLFPLNLLISIFLILRCCSCFTGSSGKPHNAFNFDTRASPIAEVKNTARFFRAALVYIRKYLADMMFICCVQRVP